LAQESKVATAKKNGTYAGRGYTRGVTRRAPATRRVPESTQGNLDRDSTKALTILGDFVMNPFDILGSLMQGGMGPSTGRLERTFGNQGFGGPGGMFGGGPGGMPSGGPGGMSGGGPGGMGGGVFDMLGKMMGSMMGGGSAPSAGGGLPGDLLKTIGGAIFGGSGGPVGSGAGPSEAGAGAISIFGTLAAQAIEYAKQVVSGAGGQAGAGAPKIDIDEATAVIAGMRKPANAQEEKQVLDVATLTIRAMLNAAKADGRIDEKEAERLVGKMQQDGVTEEERNFVINEMRKPMETDAIVRSVPNEQVAAQIYAASLMAIEVDTDAERRYLQDLSSKLRMGQPVVAYLHKSVGLA